MQVWHPTPHTHCADYALTLLQLAPAAGDADAGKQGQVRSGAVQRQRRRRASSRGMDEVDSEGGTSSEEEEDEEDLDDG